MTTTKEMQALSTEPFQDGIYFVVPNGARVTLRCAICNSSDVQRSRSVWHELLKAGVRQPTAPCEVFFCRQHAPSLTGLIFISLLTMLLGAVSMVSVLILALPDLWTFGLCLRVLPTPPLTQVFWYGSTAGLSSPLASE